MSKSFLARLAGLEDDEPQEPTAREIQIRQGASKTAPRLKQGSGSNPAADNSYAPEPDFGLVQEETAEEWLPESQEGQLAIDVYQTPESIVIKSTIAGARPEDIDVSINNDMVTVRGKRYNEEKIREEDYFYQECYWGAFSRSIVLPVEINPDESEATIKNGVLTIVLPKAKKAKSISVKVKEE